MYRDNNSLRNNRDNNNKLRSNKDNKKNFRDSTKKSNRDFNKKNNKDCRSSSNNSNNSSNNIKSSNNRSSETLNCLFTILFSVRLEGLLILKSIFEYVCTLKALIVEVVNEIMKKILNHDHSSLLLASLLLFLLLDPPLQ